jgi:hypothetical protein
VQPAAGGEEFRIDAADGCAYTRAEFLAEYGGRREWDVAPLLGAADSGGADHAAEPPPESDWSAGLAAMAAAGLDPFHSGKRTQKSLAGSANPPVKAKARSKWEDECVQLQEMGFAEERAQQALALTQGDADAAMELLLAEAC